MHTLLICYLLSRVSFLSLFFVLFFTKATFYLFSFYRVHDGAVKRGLAELVKHKQLVRQISHLAVK